ncbi:MAG: dihydroneopterin aldolase [Alphaproteobacteria bacterium]|nr:dihydroneopterin aldolase [Alphaproteobacteria bacterium]
MPRKSKPAPAGYYRVLVRDLVLAARIGVWKREKQIDQRVRVNVELLAARADLLVAPDGRTGRRDRIIRYDTVVAGIRRLVAEGHVELCEQLAERIAALCLDNRRVRTVRVRVEKLDVYPDATSVGAEVERHRT